MHIRKSERGQAIVLLVLLLVGLLGVTALAVDGGRLYYSQRTAKNAADNAALAGAYALCTGGNVSADALGSAATNGFNNDGVTNTVAVHHPPSSGPNSGDSEFVEVVINSQEETAFAQLVYTGAFETTVRAVGRCYSQSGPIGAGNGLISLADTGTCTFIAEGSGSISVVDGGIFVNSDGDSSFCVTGGATGPGGVPRVAGDWINVVGTASEPHWITVEADPPTTGVPAITVPLASLAEPAHPGGSCTDFDQGNHWWTPQIAVDPGLYCQFSIYSDANIHMNPGVYYIEGGDFSVTGAANLTGDGVLIFLADGGAHVGGSGDVTLTAATSGPWQGMVFFMGRGNNSNYVVDGAGDINITGTLYAPDAHVLIGGSGLSTSFTSQFIAWDYEVSGAGLLELTYDPDATFQGGSGGAVIDLAE